MISLKNVRESIYRVGVSPDETTLIFALRPSKLKDPVIDLILADEVMNNVMMVSTNLDLHSVFDFDPSQVDVNIYCDYERLELYDVLTQDELFDSYVVPDGCELSEWETMNDLYKCCISVMREMIERNSYIQYIN